MKTISTQTAYKITVLFATFSLIVLGYFAIGADTISDAVTIKPVAAVPSGATELLSFQKGGTGNTYGEAQLSNYLMSTRPSTLTRKLWYLEDSDWTTKEDYIPAASSAGDVVIAATSSGSTVGYIQQHVIVSVRPLSAFGYRFNQNGEISRVVISNGDTPVLTKYRVLTPENTYWE
jgi:hypothetical protein